MFNIKIADIVITIDNKYPLLVEKCWDYRTTKENNSNIVLSVTQKRMQESIDYKYNFDGNVISFEEAEYDAIHYSLYQFLYQYDAFWLHSVLIEKDGYGYAFAAAPGIGKTTHAKLWMKAFNDVVIVNGDNTIIRKNKEDNLFYGYGTPFCGKEGFQRNKKVLMKAVCYLEQSTDNYVEEMKPMDAVMRMFKENWCITKTTASSVMNLYLLMARQVKFYCVHCNMDIEAAITSFEGISK